VLNKRERRKMFAKVYRDSKRWVDFDRIDGECIALIDQGDAPQAERYFLNRKRASEGAAFDADRWAELADATVVVPDRELITVGVDGARFDDALGMVATHVGSGHQWPLGIWERPPDADDDYEHPADAVDGALLEAFERWSVWRVYVDPQMIEHLSDRWQGRWNHATDRKRQRVVEWFTNRPRAVGLMLRAYRTAQSAGDLSHDGDSVMARHIANARKQLLNVKDDEGRPLWTITKDRRGSPRKIDGAMAGGLSWEARGDAIAAGVRRRRVGVAGF
jgi:phage terminase large subunit-like protein